MKEGEKARLQKFPSWWKIMAVPENFTSLMINDQWNIKIQPLNVSCMISLIFCSCLCHERLSFPLYFGVSYSNEATQKVLDGEKSAKEFNGERWWSVRKKMGKMKTIFQVILEVEKLISIFYPVYKYFLLKWSENVERTEEDDWRTWRGVYISWKMMTRWGAIIHWWCRWFVKLTIILWNPENDGWKMKKKSMTLSTN